MTNGYNYDALNNTLTISAAFAKKASRVGSMEYNIILKLRNECPNLNIVPADKKEGKKTLNYHKMEEFIDMHRNAKELRALFEKVKKLSRVQPMPYKYVKTWFDNRFPYYSDQPTFDADGYVMDPVTLINMKEMVQEVTMANQMKALNVVSSETNVA